MVIKEKLQKAINKQINAELYSSYLYLSMAAYFESMNFKGFAHWLQLQANEENQHAMKFYAYVIERGGKVVLTEIAAPKAEWKSPLAAFEEVYAHEMKVTSLINDLMKLAKDDNDFATESLLKWYVDEQVEEEANALSIVEKLKLIKDSNNGLFMLDHELGGRK
ncbi:MAG TPA: ferritin [Candidatus Omnitrophota bacterium]|nr:ferritin [Candidatus Omnitrophota bacterium]HPD85493.1 ferritin [Candidatus Omnitrophota bacterium]HRZ04006.1 ferritin [Candidatus Omnitrophota bacterium]